LDERVIEELQKTGKGDRLFVVMNKMDKVSESERGALLEDRRAWLSKLGIRTDIFPVSHSNNLDVLDGDFNRFREALTDYIDKRLPGARPQARKRFGNDEAD